MHHDRRETPGRTAQPRTSRRFLLTWTGKLAAGAALAAVPGSRWVMEAAAQDNTVTLTGAAAEVSASPGSAVARSAVAEAAASRGAARVQAAAALAGADQENGAIAQGAAAFAAADPDEGAVAQSAVAAASASSVSDDDLVPEVSKVAPSFVIPSPGARGGCGGGRRRAGGRGGRGGGRGGRAIRAGRGGGRARRRDRAATLPDAGVGFGQSGPLPSLFAAASGLAALGAVMLRNRGEDIRAEAHALAISDGPTRGI